MIAAQGAKLPFLVLPGIRGLRPYNPTRVMRQFGKVQIIPAQGDASSFIVDYNEKDKIPFAKIILQEWAGRVNMKWKVTEDRYGAGYVDEYKTWLHKDLRGIVDPTPRTSRKIEDVETRLQIHAYHFQQEWDRREQEFYKKEQEFQQREQAYQLRELENQRVLAVMSQELADTRTCLMRLDTILDEQMNTLQAVPTSSKAAFAEPYVFTSKCIIREEVEKARRGAGSSTL